ncbi:MAG TPA: SRPBCC family protein [Thermoanaerobaculia bacterium]
MNGKTGDIHADFRGPLRPMRWAVAAVAAALIVSPGRLVACVAARPGAEIAVLVADLGDSTVQVDGRFVIRAPLAVAWDVLSDYEHLTTFVCSMRESRVDSHAGPSLVVRQRFTGRLLWLERSFNVQLSIREEPQRSIAFRDLSHADFERYEGTWTLLETEEGVEVTYRLTVKGGLVGLATKSPARRMAKELLAQLRTEIGRRSSS